MPTKEIKDANITKMLIDVEKNLRLATSKIRTDPYWAELYLQNALQGITNINIIIQTKSHERT